MNTKRDFLLALALVSCALAFSGAPALAGGASIAGAEYFIDADPGVGLGTSLEAADGFFDESWEVMIKESIASSNLALGEHTLYVRARDEDNVWGIARQLKFQVAEASPYKKIAAAECFIDTDPGVGKGVPLSPDDGLFDGSIESASKNAIATDSLCPGAHTVYVRFRDNWSNWPKFNGWGALETRTLTVYGAPCPPADFTATSECEAVYLAWQPSYSAHVYNVYRDGVKVDSVENTNCYDSIADGQQHCYAVRAENLYGEGDSTSQICLAARIRPAAPLLISPPDSQKNVPVSYDFCWSSVAGADRYQLQVSSDTGFASTIFDNDMIASVCSTVANLRGYSYLYWRVRAHNDCGWGAWGQTRQFSPVPCCLGLRGNANDDPGDKANIADVTYLMAYFFGIPLGPAPRCPEEANINGDPLGKVNIADVSYLMAYMFGIPPGPAPAPCPL